jgi:hypothetical protein
VPWPSDRPETADRLGCLNRAYQNQGNEAVSARAEERMKITTTVICRIGCLIGTKCDSEDTACQAGARA